MLLALGYGVEQSSVLGCLTFNPLFYRVSSWQCSGISYAIFNLQDSKTNHLELSNPEDLVFDRRPIKCDKNGYIFDITLQGEEFSFTPIGQNGDSHRRGDKRMDVIIVHRIYISSVFVRHFRLYQDVPGLLHLLRGGQVLPRLLP